jgi:hypothetical protein
MLMAATNDVAKPAVTTKGKLDWKPSVISVFPALIIPYDPVTAHPNPRYISANCGVRDATSGATL